MALLELEGLRVESAGKLLLALDCFSIEPGERVLVSGRNGSGKTTLLRVLAELRAPSSGRLSSTLAPAERVYVHQHPFMLRGSVLDNLCYGLAIRKVPRDEARRRALKQLASLGLEAFAERRARALSGGEARRVALARALILEPPLLLLDEPFAELDEEAAGMLRRELGGITGARSLVYTSPLPRDDRVATRRLVLDAS